MNRKTQDILLLVLMAIQAAASLLFPPYRDTGWIKDTWFGNDLVTLVVVCPLFIVSMFRKESRFMIVNAGCLGYVVYNYCFYLLGTSLNILFPLYVVLVILGILGLAARLGKGDFADALDSSFDHAKSYLVPGLAFALIGAGLGSVWLGTWASHVFGGAPLPTSEPEFRLVASLDLVVIVSSMIVSGLALLCKKRTGFILGSVIGVQGLLYLMVLALNSVLPSMKGGSPSAEAPVWFGLLALEAIGIFSLLAKNGRRRGKTEV
jgi:hypothetical protein